MLIIEKPILTTGTLNNNGKHTYYSPLFLKKLASQKGDVDIELNTHDGLSIGKATNLSFDDDKLIATMDIPDEYINFETDSAFSTDIIPNSWNGNEVTEGYLDKIVFIDDLSVNKPNDFNTITRLYNTRESNTYTLNTSSYEKNDEEDKMSDSNKLSEMYGKLQTEKDVLQQEFDKLKVEHDKLLSKHEKLSKSHEKLQASYDEGKSLYDKGKEEFEKVSEVAKKYEQQQIDKKNDLIGKLVPEDDKGVQDEFKLNMFNKLSIEELESLIKDKPQEPSTPPNGAGNVDTYVPPNDNYGGENDNIYLNYKEAYNL